MAQIAKTLTDLIGRTPLLELSNYEKAHGLEAQIVAKLEYFNPAGSVKDRIAKAMVEDAEAKGLLKEGSVIIGKPCTCGIFNTRRCASLMGGTEDKGRPEGNGCPGCITAEK